MKKYLFPLLMGLGALFLTGCVGYDFPPRIFSKKPFTLLRGSEQIGRDQLANRLMVAKGVFPMKGRHENEVLTILGQPQHTRVIEQGISEDWLFAYYPDKGLKEKLGFNSNQAQFMVRFYHDEVIDVIRDF